MAWEAPQAKASRRHNEAMVMAHADRQEARLCKPAYPPHAPTPTHPLTCAATHSRRSKHHMLRSAACSSATATARPTAPAEAEAAPCARPPPSPPSLRHSSLSLARGGEGCSWACCCCCWRWCCLRRPCMRVSLCVGVGACIGGKDVCVCGCGCRGEGCVCVYL